MCEGFLRQVARSIEDKGGDYNFEDFHDGCKLIEGT